MPNGSRLPKLATIAGRRLQIDAGLRSHERRFGLGAEGFWLPECAYAPGLERAWLPDRDDIADAIRNLAKV